jgi:hypothetical protein
VDQRQHRMPAFGKLTAKLTADEPGSAGHQDPQ